MTVIMLSSERRPEPARSYRYSVGLFTWGQDFNTTLAPAMRFIVDFGQAEPLMLSLIHISEPTRPY